MTINLANKPTSTTTNTQNKIVRAVVLSHNTYSTKRVNKKYNNPIAKNKIIPLSNSLV
ncbi:hypothetical protein GCM10022271_06320 [Corallibacter vietnamensis]|uniref:Uncharacterized protein n=1 Tax=Corallibacter vietnamensis TaxID=904130 RepID=A0ABP7GW83_9FLAO